MVHVIMVALIGITIPVLGCPMARFCCNGAYIAEIFMMVQVILFLRGPLPLAKPLPWNPFPGCPLPWKPLPLPLKLRLKLLNSPPLPMF